jgi:hypothetical protein
LGFTSASYMLTMDRRRPQDVVGFPIFSGRQWGPRARDARAALLH